jgi:hypothetical protein
MPNSFVIIVTVIIVKVVAVIVVIVIIVVSLLSELGTSPNTAINCDKETIEQYNEN